MSIKELSSKKLYKEYQVDVPFEEVDNLINSKIKEMIPTIDLPGFRKGKAPISIVKKKYENNILGEIIEKIAREQTKKLLDEKKLQAFRMPKVEVKKYNKDEPVELIIKIDIKPEINIYDFNKIKTIKYIINIDKKTSKDNYNNFLASQKKYIKIDNKRPIKFTDKIIVNIFTEDESVPKFLKSQNNVTLITDSDFQVLPDISNKLIKKGVKIDDQVKLKFNLKEVLKEKNDKFVEFSIKIISVEESVKFKIDKEFLDKNKLKSENELIENLNKNIEYQYENSLREIEKKQLMDILEVKNNFDIPQGIYDDEFNLIWHRVEHAKKDNKLDEDDKGLSDQALKKRYEKIALRRVKLAMLMQYIAEMNNIKVSEKELSEGLANYASQYPGQEKEIFEYFKKNPQNIESIKGPIFEKKIIDFILSKTLNESKKISVKEFEQLQKNTFNFKKGE